MKQFSVVPDTFRDRDPRNLLYHFPNMPVVKYAKLMQEYCFYKQLQVAEDIAHKQGFILVPFECMHWQRKKNFASDRKVKIGRNSYFMMKVEEMTKVERVKLEQYLEGIKQAS